jgi:hypothetical protein
MNPKTNDFLDYSLRYIVSKTAINGTIERSDLTIAVTAAFPQYESARYARRNQFCIPVILSSVIQYLVAADLIQYVDKLISITPNGVKYVSNHPRPITITTGQLRRDFPSASFKRGESKRKYSMKKDYSSATCSQPPQKDLVSLAIELKQVKARQKEILVEINALLNA